jgi:hypothetical protein
MNRREFFRLARKMGLFAAISLFFGLKSASAGYTSGGLQCYGRFWISWLGQTCTVCRAAYGVHVDQVYLKDCR